MFGFGKAKPGPEAMLVELIEHNADLIVADEGKDRAEATYLATRRMTPEGRARLHELSENMSNLSESMTRAILYRDGNGEKA